MDTNNNDDDKKNKKRRKIGVDAAPQIKVKKRDVVCIDLTEDSDSDSDVEFIPSHKCDCGKSFIDYTGLHFHILTAHRTPPLSADEASARIRKQKTVGKKECVTCSLKFNVDDNEGLYIHWEGDHRKYPEEENPYPSPSG